MRYLGSALVAIAMLAPCLARAQDAKAGAQTFTQQCASCHGPKARGGEGPDLTGHIYMHGADDQSVAHSIRDGQPGGMPAFRASLSDADIANLVAFLTERRDDPTNPPLDRPYAFTPSLPKGVLKTDVERFRVQTVAKVGAPYGFVFLPDGRILITELSGSLRVVEKGRLLPTPISDAPTGGVEGRRGQPGRNLLDVAIDPDYKHNGWIYLSTARPVKGAAGAREFTARITRGRIRDGHWVDSQILNEFPIESPTALRMAFDAQRNLYIGVSWPDYLFVTPQTAPKTPPQMLSSSMGKILRMTADGKVPQDNPFVGKPDAYPYVFAYGNRAPLGLAFNRQGELWETENGPRGGDELNHIKAGLNYGWPGSSWGLRYDDIPAPAEPEQKGVEQPVINWSPSPAVSAIAFYYGKAFARWNGDLIMGSLKQTDLYRIVLDGDRPVLQEVIVHALGRIRDVQIGPDGFVYVLTDEGNLVRLVPARG
jgi:glucose/arabinose dehydrogenase